MGLKKFNEFVQLDELSKQTLGNYVKKAYMDADNHAVAARQHLRQTHNNPDRKAAERHNDAAIAHQDKEIKRIDGVKLAAKKLMKEGIEALSYEEMELLGENYEQLDEISKQTLGSYIKKARTDAINQRDDAHDSNRLARSMSGDDTRKEYEKKRDTHVRKFGNRNRGIDKAVDKLVKEGIEAVSEEELDEIFENYEQLDELSKQTLGRYINAASDKGMQSAHIAGGGTGYRHDGDKADRSKEFSKAVKRLKGIRKATDKLVKEGAEALSFDELELLGESFEMLNELSKQTLSNYIVKSARDMHATGYEQGKAYGRGASNGEVKPMIRRANKRRAGIIRASDKLAEEGLGEAKEPGRDFNITVLKDGKRMYVHSFNTDSWTESKAKQYVTRRCTVQGIKDYTLKTEYKDSK